MPHRLKRKIQKTLSDCPLRTLDDEWTADAAVLMPIFERNQEAHFLLTLRTQDVATHKGDVSFPGGLREEIDESLNQTALRETEEEVGISPRYVEILGPFHEYLAVTRYRVTPFVALLDSEFMVSPNPQEVERVLEVPFRFFREVRPKTERRRRLGKYLTVYFYDFEGVSIWGLTALMIREFLESLDE